MVELQSVLVHSRTVWIEHPEHPGFEVKIKYLPRSEMRTITERCHVMRPDKRTRTMQREIDVDRLAAEMAGLVVGWRGLTPDILAELVPINKADLAGVAEIPYTPENCKVLLDEAYGFDNWVFGAATDAGAFAAEAEEDDIKNS